MHELIIFIIGALAAVLTSFALFPQVVKAHTTRHTKDLSLAMYFAIFAGTALWVVYGVLLRQVPIIAANAIACSLCTYIIFLKIKYG